MKTGQNKTLYHVQKYVIVSRDGSLLEIERGAGLRPHDGGHHVVLGRVGGDASSGENLLQTYVTLRTM